MQRRRLKSLRFLCAALFFLSLAGTSGCGFVGGGEYNSNGLPPYTPKTPNVVSLNPQDWYIQWGNDVGPHPSVDPEGAWSFQFPIWDESKGMEGHVNYVETPFDATKTPQAVTITFKVESQSPQYQVFGDLLPATFRLFFQVKNDNFISADGHWWAQPSMYDIGPQDNQVHVITIPLTPDQWGNVYGKNGRRGVFA